MPVPWRTSAVTDNRTSAVAHGGAPAHNAPMQTRSKIFEDLSKVAQGATQSLIGVRAEVEAVVRAQLSKLLGGMDLVQREEFDAVRAMAMKAREENEKLEARIRALEAPKKASPKKVVPSQKPAARKSPAKKTS